MDLRVALAAIAEERCLLAHIVSNIGKPCERVRSGSWSRAVSRVAPQAKECFWLMQQVIGDGAMWRVANAAILRRRWVLVCKRTLFVGMATVAQLVDSRFL